MTTNQWDARNFPCPFCKAQPGESCKLSTMPYQPVEWFHRDRRAPEPKP
jgi:hypothetical protein